MMLEKWYVDLISVYCVELYIFAIYLFGLHIVAVLMCSQYYQHVLVKNSYEC